MDQPGQEQIGETFLLVNATLAEDVSSANGSDVWESMVLQSADMRALIVTLQFTLCMTAFQAYHMEINATQPLRIPPEPTLTWNWNTSSPAYNTSAVLRQLGAEQSIVQISERTILDLQPRSW